MYGRHAHRAATFILSLVMGVIGVALIVQAIAAGSPISARALLGVLFVAAGVGRSYLEVRRQRGA
jgi:hypothetical protein